MNTFEITIQRKFGDTWPVVVEESRGGVFLPVRKRRRGLKIEEAAALGESNSKIYGTLLGDALFRGDVRDSFVQSLRESRHCLHVLLFY